MTWSKERRQAYELAKKILRVQAGDLTRYGQSIIRIDRDEIPYHKIPMRTFYVRPRKKFMTPAEHMAELRKFTKGRKPR